MSVTLDPKHESCISQMTVHFEKGQTILTMGDNNGRVGILLSGEAHVSAIDENGNEMVLELLSRDDCFGEYLMMPSVSQFFLVIADSNCTVNFINFKNVLFHCRNNCENHANLVRELLLMTARRAQTLSLHTSILSQHSIREKLTMYLKVQEDLMGPGPFTIPMPLSKLSDYLSVDRTAMMREIRKMNDEGLIASSGREFEFL